MRLEILHVPDCPNTAVLIERLGKLVPSVVIERRVIRNQTEAVVRGMTGSPTLLVDGVDPFAVAGLGPSVSCRLYLDEHGDASGAPTTAQLRAALAGIGPMTATTPT